MTSNERRPVFVQMWTICKILAKRIDLTIGDSPRVPQDLLTLLHRVIHRIIHRIKDAHVGSFIRCADLTMRELQVLEDIANKCKAFCGPNILERAACIKVPLII